MSSKNKPRDDDDDGGDDEDIHIEDPEKLSSGPKVPHILLKEGFLQKKSPKGILKVWQSRYFRLYTDGLQYFKAKKDAQPAGTIPLFSITEVGIPDKHKKKGDRFDVTVGDKKGGRTFALVASSKEECKKWVDLLQKLLKDRDDAMKEASGGSAAVSLNVKTDGKIWKDQGKAENINAKAQNRAIANAMAGVKPGDSAPKTESKGPVSVDLGNVKLIREESVGPIGAVYIAQDKKSTSASLGLPQQQYLVHAVKRNDPDFKVADQLFKDMRMLNSPYIIKQLTSGDSDDYQFVFYSPPFTSDDALVAYLEKHRRLPEDVVRHFAAQLSLALGYLHGKGLNYPALNPDTVYINADGNVVLGDILCALPNDKIPDDALLPEYTTPERIETQYADWWRLGVLLYEMSVGIPPFRSKAENKEDDIAKQVAGFQPDKLRFPPFVPAQLQDFIRRLLNPDPKKRLGAGGTGKDIEDIKQHEFMAGEISWSDYQHERGTPPEKCPGWVRKNVLENPKTEEHVKSLRAMPVKHVSRVNLQLFAARNLPGAKSTIAVVRCEDKTQQTPAKDGASPEWNEKYKFDVHYFEGELGIDLNHASGNPLGHVTISLQDIKSQYPNPVDVWLPIYDSNAMASGELHVCYTWEEQRVDLPMPTYVKVELEKKFYDNFGQPASSAGKTRSASGVKKASIIAAPKKEDEKKKEEVKKEEPAKKEDPKPKAEAKKAAPKQEDDDDGDAPPPPPAPEEDDDKKKQANGKKHKNSDAGDSSDDEKGDKGARGRSDSNDSDDGDSDKQWQEIQRMEAEKAKKAEEERKKREEEEEKRLAEEEARRKLEDEETERMLREEEERRRRDAEEAEKMRMEAEEIRRMEAEASGGDTAKPSGPSAAEKAAAEEAAKAAAQASARAAAEAAAQAAEEARAAAREEQKRLLEAERAKFQAERDALAAARREFEELRRQRQIEEEQRRLDEEKRALEDEKRRMEEDIRIAKERDEEDRRIKAEREAAKKLADEKLKLEAERSAIENARIAAEKAQIEKARHEAEETARLAAEQKIAAERARMEMELNLAKLAMEKKAAEEIAARIAFERAETARVEREKKEAEEAEKRRKEQEEKDRIAKIEKDSLGPCHTCACNTYKKDLFKKLKCSGCFHEHHVQPAIGFCKDAGCKCVPAEYKPHQFKPNTCAACYHEHHEKSDPHAWHKAHSGPAKPAVTSAPVSPEPKKAAEPKKVETPKVEAKKPAVSTTPGAGSTAPANQPTTPANRPSVAGTGAAPKAGAPANTPLSPSNAGAKKEAPKVAAAPASADAHETHGPCKSAGCTCKDWTKDAFKKNRCATCFHDH